ncbi:MAG: hypothetical protein CM15mV21_1370 [Eurybiavirus sp.]|nr:MAG: hypothetical protein CM15mV21_1370 [Eurybiavirus sp.]
MTTPKNPMNQKKKFAGKKMADFQMASSQVSEHTPKTGPNTGFV